MPQWKRGQPISINTLIQEKNTLDLASFVLRFHNYMKNEWHFVLLAWSSQNNIPHAWEGQNKADAWIVGRQSFLFKWYAVEMKCDNSAGAEAQHLPPSQPCVLFLIFLAAVSPAEGKQMREKPHSHKYNQQASASPIYPFFSPQHFLPQQKTPTAHVQHQLWIIQCHQRLIFNLHSKGLPLHFDLQIVFPL